MSISFQNKFRFFVLTIWNMLIFLSLLAQPKTITILHTNDMHAGFVPHEAFWIKETPKPFIGGFNELSFAVDSLRHNKKRILLLDAGDVMTGDPITEFEYKGANGGALFQMMNFIGYDAWTVGNHDFDISQDNLRRLIKIARFPTVNANIVDSTGRLFFNDSAYTVCEKNGLKIAIIGIMSNQFHHLVNQNSSAGINILPPASETQKWINKLRPSTDIIIALTHEGVDDDSILAMSTTGLDVIVGGHSHTRLRHPKIVNDVIIVQAGSNCENLGILDLTVDNHKVVKYNGKLLPLWYDSKRRTTQLSVFIDSIKGEIDQRYADVIGILKTDWARKRGESGIGNFITDAQREAASADIAFMNSHGIRKDIPAGQITKRDLFEMLPLRNILTKFELSGKQIRQIVEYYIDERPAIQTSGLQVEWRRGRDKHIEFLKFLINGQPLDEDKTYFGAANDYMMNEAERYLGIEKPNVTFLNQTVLEVVEKKIRELKVIESVVEHRIRRMK